MDLKSAESDARLDHQEQAASPDPTTYARAGQMWTREEKLNLVQLIRSGASIEEIAEQLQRSPSAIRTKLEEKGLLASREPDVELETAFNDAMLYVYEVAAKHKYHATRFKQLVKNRGGVEAARLLLARDKITTGLTELQKLIVSLLGVVDVWYR